MRGFSKLKFGGPIEDNASGLKNALYVEVFFFQVIELVSDE